MLFTIGFTGHGAESFFEALKDARVRRVLDIRRSNTSQLAGFTKKDDLPYFLAQICNAGYVHLPELSPETDLFRSFRAGKIDWDAFSRQFQAQLSRDGAIEGVAELDFDGACLLCACSSPIQCHRRTVAEMLSERLPGLEVRHL